MLILFIFRHTKSTKSHMIVNWESKFWDQIILVSKFLVQDDQTKMNSRDLMESTTSEVPTRKFRDKKRKFLYGIIFGIRAYRIPNIKNLKD